MCFFKSVKKITGILLHYMGAIMVCVLGHVHGAARESKYTKNSIHKCYNVTLLRGTVENTCFCISFVLPRNCLSYLKHP